MFIDKIKVKYGKATIYSGDEVYPDLNVLTLATYRFTSKQDVDYGHFREFLLESELQNAKDYIMNSLSYTSKTEREIREKLKEKGFRKAAVDEAVEKAKEYGFISDERFAESFVNMRSSNKGKIRLKAELRAKGVDDSIISKALTNIDGQEDDNCLAVAKKYMKNKQMDKETNIKLQTHLARKGFNFSSIRAAVKQVSLQTEEFDTEEFDAD